MHSATIITMIAGIAASASASPAKKPAPVAKVAPDSNLAVVVVGAISGWGYEQSTTPVCVPFGKLTHFDKLPISSLKVKGVMVSGNGLPVPKDDKVRYRLKFHRYVAIASTVGAHVMTNAALKHGEETHRQFLSFQQMVPMTPILYKAEGKKIGEKLW